MIYIGLPQWSHPKWARLGITSLEEYARRFWTARSPRLMAVS